MTSISSVGFNTPRALRHALATKLVETNKPTAIAVPHVQTFDMVEMVSLLSKRAIIVVSPTASPVWINMGVETLKIGAFFPNW